MRVDLAREAARQWVRTASASLPGFRGAYTAGSTNWLSDDAELPASADLDLMLVLADPYRSITRSKFHYQGVLLETTYLREDLFRLPDQILGDYHLAPSLATAHLLADPTGILAALQAEVRREYATPAWVRRRCAQTRDRVLHHLKSRRADAPLHDQAIATLFGAGVLAHLVLVAGLRNPTIRTRYVAARQLLSSHGRLSELETLLELLGATRVTRAQAEGHLAALDAVFDTASRANATPFPFAGDLSAAARPIVFEGSRALFDDGFHREAMFWIAVTHSRCRQVLVGDSSAHQPPGHEDSYRDLLAALGLDSESSQRRRCAQIEQALPHLWSIAAAIAKTERTSRQICESPPRLRDGGASTLRQT